MSAAEPFVPALRFHALTGLFDPFMSALMKKATLRRRAMRAPGARAPDARAGFPLCDLP